MRRGSTSDTDIDWHDRRVLLRSATPVAVRAAHATFECAYGVVQRPTHPNTSWDAGACSRSPAHRFVDLSRARLRRRAAQRREIRPSARAATCSASASLRSPIYPDPLADEGEQSFTYALMPHAGELA